ncbi:endonuclease 4 [Phtheirospermum japonicum]|uniref:Aspergillus nuclease S1 n=1 Tax=Phtheirospermum japonicum TaxID=374723 RepID=A0A830DEF0_9LAMI|nr:endonuclease 4 [Phtheirospermum japonicum]
MRVFIFLLLTPRIHGWGKEGHYAVCKIAENYLSEDALTAVKALLPENAEGDLANVCSWADEIKFHNRWSSPLHYVDTPDFRCNYQYCRDCHDSHGRKGRCVTAAIHNYTMQLMSKRDDTFLSAAKYNLTEALMFLSHFIGDVHQPLHVGFIGDEGGNTIIVRWFRRKTNLHHVWDTMIIESAMKTFYNKDLATMIQSIQNNITDLLEPEAAHAVQMLLPDYVNGDCHNPHGDKDMCVAGAIRNFTDQLSHYGHGTSDRRYDYFNSRLPIVMKRIAQGGVRLAMILNRVFGDSHEDL